MSLIKIDNLLIAGISCAVPKNKVKVQFGENKSTTTEAIGITEKRIAPERMKLSDLLLPAAESLMSELKWETSSIDGLIVVSQTPDYFIPGLSMYLANQLNLNQSTFCLDHRMGCSGFLYGLQSVGSLFATKQFKRCLLVCGDLSSYAIKESDTALWSLFGDAGAAIALENKEGLKAYFENGTDGKNWDAIYCKHGATANHLQLEQITEKSKNSFQKQLIHLEMDGLRVMEFCLKNIPKSINDLLRLSDTQKDEIDYFVFHQANLFIINSITRKLQIDPNKLLNSINLFGNTSSASIPLSLTINRKLELNYKKLLFSAFGVGLSWSSAIVDLNEVTFTELIEV